jgi:hypothetical protein
LGGRRRRLPGSNLQRELIVAIEEVFIGVETVGDLDENVPVTNSAGLAVARDVAFFEAVFEELFCVVHNRTS